MYWNNDLELSPLALSALHLNLTTERLSDLLYQCKPYAGADAAIGVALVEGVEDVGEVFGADARAGVGHDKVQPVFVSCYSYAHLTAFGRELKGVAEQVVENLIEIVGLEVCYHRALRGAEGYGDAVLAPHLAEAFHGHLSVGRYIGRLRRLLAYGGAHLRDFEKLVHEVQQLPALALYGGRFGRCSLLVAAFLQFVAEAEDHGQRRPELVSDVGEERLARFLQLAQCAVGARLLEAGPRERCRQGCEQQNRCYAAEEYYAVEAVLLCVLCLQLFVVETGVGLPQCLLQLYGVKGIGQRGVALQCLQSSCGVYGFECFADNFQVVTHSAHIAHFLLYVHCLAQDGGSLGIAPHVQQVPALIFHAYCQQVAVDDGHCLHHLDGALCHLEPELVLAVAVVGVAQLREMVCHAGIVAYGFGRFHGLPSVVDGLLHLACSAEDLAGHAQSVVQLAVLAQLPVGLDGFYDEVLGMLAVGGADVVVYDGEVEVGARELHDVACLLAVAQRLLLGLGCLGHL